MSLLNFKAQNHPQQVGKRGADDTTDDRRTPDDLWQQWHARWQFNVDAAANEESAKCEHFYAIEHDGLRQPWFGRVWCNPPYSNVGAWVAKARFEMERAAGPDVIVMLVPANRTEQRWWQENIEPQRDAEPLFDGHSLRVEFLPGRIRFNRPGWTKPAKGDRPPFGLCLLIWERIESAVRVEGSHVTVGRCKPLADDFQSSAETAARTSPGRR